MGEWWRVRIGDFLHRARSPVPLRDDEEYKLVTVRMHHNGVVLREKKKGKLIGSNMYRVKTGQFILSGIDARHGAFGVIPEELDGAIVTNDFWYFDVDDAVVSRDFFLWLTTTPLFLDACIKSSEGTTNRRRLQGEKFYNFAFRFPDIAEQHRLAERFAAFDASHSALKGEFEVQLDLLKQLRQAVLQEAVEGKLTADWRKQHPMMKGDPQHDAAALLAQIDAKKQAVLSAGRRKERTTENRVTFREISLPPSWQYCKADDIFFVTKLAGFEYTDHMRLLVTGEVPVIRAQNVRPLKLDKSNLLYIDLATSTLLERCALTKPALLMTFIGAGIGDVAFFNEAERWHLAPNVAKMEPIYEPLCNLRYLNYFLLSQVGQREVFKHVKATAQPCLSMGTIRDIDFVLPPLAEQQAIVTRVDSLMAIIDELEKQVAERKEQAQLLMQEVLREAFADGEGVADDDVCVGATHASPVSGIHRKSRARHASPLREAAFVGNVGADRVRPGSMQRAPTEDLPLVAENPVDYTVRGQAALPAANQPAPGGIPARILAAMQPGRDYSRADLLAATGISEADWIWAIRQLKEKGRVIQQGEKRGAKYSK